MTTLREMGQTDRLGSSQISRLAGSPLVRAPLIPFALLACAALAACGSKAAEAPPPAQPLSEERATHLIAGILEQSGSQPAHGMAVPPAVEGAMKDAVSQYWNDDKQTAKDAQAKILAASKTK